MVDVSLTSEAPAVSSVIQDQAPAPLSPTQQRILACFQLGWKIEQLAGVCRVQDQRDTADQPGFPPDLPAAQLQQVQLLMQELGALLSRLGISSAASGNGSRSGPAAPDLGAAVQSWITAGTTDPSPILTALLSLDSTVVPYLVTEEPDSASETAYELGKALGLTYWDIVVAGQQPGPEAVPRAWAVLFASERVRAIQRRLSLLGSIFSQPDSAGTNPSAAQVAQAMQVVSSSLEYWRHAVRNLDAITAAAHRHPPLRRSESASPPSSPLIDSVIQSSLAGQPDVFPLLLSSLQAQQAVWYDILTGQRSVDSLCPTGILLSITEDMVGNTWKRLKHFLPLLAGLFITIAIFGVLVALGVIVLHKFIGQDASAAASVLTVLGAGATYMAATGSTLLRRGQSAARQVELRTQEVVNDVQQTAQEVVKATGPAGARAAVLVHQGLDAVIEQIKQEEYTVLASQPLVLFVLRRAQQETGDPLQDATAFLRLVYGGRSNLERLLTIFPEMYVAAAVAG